MTLGIVGAAGAGFSASSVLGHDAVTTVVSPEHALVSTKVVSAKAGKGRKGLKVLYPAFRRTVQPNQEDGGQVKCPKSAPHAVAGIFRPASDAGFGQIVLSNSNPGSENGKVWDIGVKNLSPQPQEYLGGAVCIG